MLKSNILSDLNDDEIRIFDYIQKNGPLTKNDIVSLLDIKLTTLIRFMKPLEKAGLIVNANIGSSTGGRKPILYDVNPNKYYLVGIDISRIYCQIVIVNLKIEMIYKTRFNMENNYSAEFIVNKICMIAKSALKDIVYEEKIVLGIGVGAVGPLDREKGMLINPIHFKSSGWKDINLKNIFEECLESFTILDNGANTAAFVETFYGVGRGFKNVVYINIGMGIRTGAIFSKTILRAINDSEDAFAHMVVNINGNSCGCGDSGCIESYASIFAIKEQFNREYRNIHGKEVGDIDYIDICDMAKKGNNIAIGVLKNAASTLGIGLANFINIVNPYMVIISGPLINNSKLFYDVCIDSAMKKCHLNKNYNIKFSKGGKFGVNSISMGAAALCLENIIRKTR